MCWSASATNAVGLRPSCKYAALSAEGRWNDSAPQRGWMLSLEHGRRDVSKALLYSARSRVRELASGMGQLAGTKTGYRRADDAPLARLISGPA